MADLKISQLTGASTPLAGTEVLPIVQSGSTKKVSVADLTLGRAVASAGGTFSDNFVQGTAAKGVNFTANTPAAGMTSQLLNWYEEGTFTPTATAGSGTITSYTATGHYTRVGKTVTIFVSIEITNPGSASGNLNFAALPFTSKNVGGYIASINAREDNVTGAVFDVLIQGNATTGLIVAANWTTNVRYLFSATYLLA